MAIDAAVAWLARAADASTASVSNNKGSVVVVDVVALDVVVVDIVTVDVIVVVEEVEAGVVEARDADDVVEAVLEMGMVDAMDAVDVLALHSPEGHDVMMPTTRIQEILMPRR